ncbi:MAG TPA: flagellar biosynthetic protein FliO [Devosia sp.]|nr:flagellar biosynthetic protein FliO [Devosia sp.]
MQFLTSLFSGSESTFLTVAVALVAVIFLALAGLWSVRTFSRASKTFVRGRNRRLTVVDQVSIDQRRQLIIVRRDNVEHLILVGGPQDLVVESGIVAERPAAAMPHRAPAPAPAPVPERAARPPAPAAAEIIEPRPSEAEVARSSTAMERLREMARPAPRRPDSLRHTGLLRPVTRMEAAVIPISPDAVEGRRADPAKGGKGE